MILRQLLSTRQALLAEGRDSSGLPAPGAGRKSEAKQWLGLGFGSGAWRAAFENTLTAL